MATLVCFHAHPDDEAIATGGVMAQAAAGGHRVVLIVATRGEQGEVVEGVLRPGEPLHERRVIETEAAALILGVKRVEFLGYTDSGMMGTSTNDDPTCFWRADVEEAARRLAAILEAESADVLTVYDDNGGYGHPDHIQVHRVGVRAAELAGTPRVFEATMNQDRILAMMKEAEEAGADITGGPETQELEAGTFGKPESALTTAVDVTAHLPSKRQAMRAHASQISDESFFLAMPDDVFAMAFGTEWFIRRGVPTPVDTFEASLLDGLDGGPA
jgi:LmbE family N-acetylglucosaminyl deacetylase